MEISFITLASYDWQMLPTSIASYYDVADEIIVGLDRDRLTWSGTRFELDGHKLHSLLRSIDPNGKIRVIERSFFTPFLFPLENDTEERRRLAWFARGDVIAEVDADEIVDGRALAEAAAGLPDGCQLYAPWVNIYKTCGDVALVVDSSAHLAPIATRSRFRYVSRKTNETPVVDASLSVEHLTCGRSRDDLLQKLRGWGHSNQVRPDFLPQWDYVTVENYAGERALHPFIPERWPSLMAVSVSSLKWGSFIQRGCNVQDS